MIETKNLNKSFYSYKKLPGFSGAVRSLFKREMIEKKAIKEFNLEIKKGEIVGLLGPNGAGKTTLMKMFTGIIVPSAGEVKVLGHNPYDRHKEFRKKIALVMGQKSQLWWDIPAMDSFCLLQKYYEVDDVSFHDRIEELSTLMAVKDLLHIQVRRLSLGERMKLELMASLIHRPEVIFLDEPTIGLDVSAQENIRQFILSYHKRHGTSIVITSHYMADVEALCQRLVVVFGGEKFFDGNISDFSKILGHQKILSFQFKEAINPLDPLFERIDARWSLGNRKVDIRIPEDEMPGLASLLLNKYQVEDFASEKISIERVLQCLMEKNITERSNLL